MSVSQWVALDSRSLPAPDLFGRIHAFLPEIVPNRAEALEGIDLAGWLRAVVATDGSGYTVLAGGGITFVLLYANGTPVAASLSGHSLALTGAGAVERLLADGSLDVFALTHVTEPAVALALSSLFGEPGPRLRLDADDRALSACLTAASGERASGALLVDAGDDAWSILLLADGEVVAGYGSDDRELKPGIDDVTVLLLRDQLWTTRLSQIVSDLGPTLVARTTPAQHDRTDTDLHTIELSLITGLSRLEHALTRAGHAETDSRHGLVVDAFLAFLAELDNLAVGGRDGEVARVAGIRPTPRPAAVFAIFQERIAGYVTRLSRSDDASTRYLHDVATELVQQARAITRR